MRKIIIYCLLLITICNCVFGQKKDSIGFTNTQLSNALVGNVKLNQVSPSPNFKRKAANNTLEIPE